MAYPTLPSKITSINQLWTFLAKVLHGGIGDDRPLVYLGDAVVTVDTNGETVTVPPGTTMFKMLVGAGDVHVEINGTPPATTSNYKYLTGQEYIEGPFDSAITSLAAIRVTVDSICHFKFYKRAG